MCPLNPPTYLLISIRIPLLEHEFDQLTQGILLVMKLTTKIKLGIVSPTAIIQYRLPDLNFYAFVYDLCLGLHIFRNIC